MQVEGDLYSNKLGAVIVMMSETKELIKSLTHRELWK